MRFASEAISTDKRESDVLVERNNVPDAKCHTQLCTVRETAWKASSARAQQKVRDVEMFNGPRSGRGAARKSIKVDNGIANFRPRCKPYTRAPGRGAARVV